MFSPANEVATTTGQGYFFVVGFPRSGTTLLSVLLDRHSRLCVPPETAFFDEVAPQLTDCTSSVLMSALENWPRLTELGLEPDMVLQRVGEKTWDVGEVLAAILDLYALRQRKLRAGEKTPQHLLHVPTIFQFFPQARILCLLRDGRDAALSLRSMPWGFNLIGAADLWQRYVSRMDEFVTKYPNHFMVVRYEHLLADAEKVLTTVMEFLSESFEAQQLSTKVPSRVVLPRSMEWKGKSLEPIDLTLADRRRYEASPEDLTLLERMLADDLRRWGYVN